MGHFTVSIDTNNEYYYSTRNPISILEVFLKYCNQYEKDRYEWEHDNVNGIRQLHAKKKKDDCQYNFFTVNERELGYFVNTILHLVSN